MSLCLIFWLLWGIPCGIKDAFHDLQWRRLCAFFCCYCSAQAGLPATKGAKGRSRQRSMQIAIKAVGVILVVLHARYYHRPGRGVHPEVQALELHILQHDHPVLQVVHWLHLPKQCIYSFLQLSLSWCPQYRKYISPVLLTHCLHCILVGYIGRNVTNTSFVIYCITI